jgi:hypothetical protein
MAEEAFDGKNKSWWKFIWASKASNKTKILLWLKMENKILTWDNGLKIG